MGAGDLLIEAGYTVQHHITEERRAQVKWYAERALELAQQQLWEMGPWPLHVGGEVQEL